MSSTRIDKLMVEVGLAQTRSQANSLIKEGVVFFKGDLVTKPSFKLEVQEASLIEVRKEHVFVGRGAHKLEGAHRHFDLKFDGKIIADIGASTGGFTEYALLHGARKIFAIDVGHDQLAQKLCSHPSVVNMEGTNIKNELNLDELCDMAVVDLSFISLKLVAKNIAALVKEKGEIIFLIKPQFEVGRDSVGKNGIVKDLAITANLLESMTDFFSSINISVKGKMPSPIKGKGGNQEHLFYCTKS